MATASVRTLALPSVVDLDALDAIRDRLADALESGPVTLDAGAVERVSTNALFLLLAAAETARRHKFAFAIAQAAPALTGAIARLGLTERFEEYFTQ
jgi:anti-anti-sigma regulatory factor